MDDNSTTHNNGAYAGQHGFGPSTATPADGSAQPGLATQRPDPAVDHEAYKQWYMGLDEQSKSAEWQKYYSAAGALHSNSMAEAADSLSDDQPHTSNASRSDEVEAETPIFNRHSPAQPQNLRPSAAATIHRKAASARLVAGKHAKKNRHNLQAIFMAGSVIIILVAVMQNQLLIAKARSYITPSESVGQSQIIISSNNTVSAEPRIIIPKIGVDVPVVFDQPSLEEDAIQASLNDGVVHYNYSGTVKPGQTGNSVILGHSSSNFFGSGKYKFAFVLLNRLEDGDTFMVHYNSKRYTYRVFDSEIVAPTDFSQIQEQFDKPVMTLITCDPPGTNTNRLIVQGEQIDPDPVAAEKPAPSPSPTTGETPLSVPSDDESLWSQLWGKIF